MKDNYIDLYRLFSTLKHSIALVSITQNPKDLYSTLKSSKELCCLYRDYYSDFKNVVNTFMKNKYLDFLFVFI